MATDILNIVIADDDVDDLELFQTALSEVYCNVNVTTAQDGDELINLLDELPIPDAIVLDLNMPKKAGLECLKEIRGNSDFADVPIIILSTSASPKDKNSCLEHGANLYFSKPDSYHEMKVIAQQICNKETYR
ncbi:MAG TPA: response regulator [Segetibacter sp.]|jgi:CheY-like chemotaxis protein